MADDPVLPNETAAALRYGETLMVHRIIAENDFYKSPTDSANAPAGTLLKLETATDTSKYMLPPATALSRFLFQSRTLQGSLVPSSAYVLWPFQPRTQPDGKYPVVAWAHGTAGVHENCAPSNTKTLWQHWQAPFPLALQGYVVVAPDYAGLGVGKTADGEEIAHQYMANPAQANDIIFAVQAAQEAFPQLSSDFVVIGHSQGGGAAWATAERQVQEPVKGYLGAVAISPITNILELPLDSSELIPILSLYAAPTMQQLYPEFKPEDFFTPKGWERYQLECEVGSFTPVLAEIMTGFQALQDGWSTNRHLQSFIELTAAGGRKIGGPLLVIQGEADEAMDFATTSRAVEKTRKAAPDSTLQYLTLPGVTHVPTMYAAQRIWLDWIADRFCGGKLQGGYERQRAVDLPRHLESYQMAPNWAMEINRGRFLLDY